MMNVRRAQDRGHFDHGWLNTFHSFSFADYHDPRHMGFGDLRVINEDVIAPGAGFPTHAHRDMEILTYVLKGALEHRDSSGGGGIIRAGEVQRMSAGSGIRHSEQNASTTEPVHLLQIWILPERQQRTPGYEQRAFSANELDGQLRLIAAPEGVAGALAIGQDARVYAARLQSGRELVHRLAAGRRAWVQGVRGEMVLNGQPLKAGDGASLTDEVTLNLVASEPSELLLFDLR